MHTHTTASPGQEEHVGSSSSKKQASHDMVSDAADIKILTVSAGAAHSCKICMTYLCVCEYVIEFVYTSSLFVLKCEDVTSDKLGVLARCCVFLVALCFPLLFSFLFNRVLFSFPVPGFSILSSTAHDAMHSII